MIWSTFVILFSIPITIFYLNSMADLGWFWFLCMYCFSRIRFIFWRISGVQFITLASRYRLLRWWNSIVTFLYYITLSKIHNTTHKQLRIFEIPCIWSRSLYISLLTSINQTHSIKSRRYYSAIDQSEFCSTFVN